MSKQKRTITSERGKRITMMIDPEDTNQHIYSVVEWKLSKSQWRRICREDSNTTAGHTAWRTEKGASIRFV